MKFFDGMLGSIDGDSIRAYRLWLQKQKVGDKSLNANAVARILSDLRAAQSWRVRWTWKPTTPESRFTVCGN